MNEDKKIDKLTHHQNFLLHVSYLDIYLYLYLPHIISYVKTIFIYLTNQKTFKIMCDLIHSSHLSSFIFRRKKKKKKKIQIIIILNG